MTDLLQAIGEIQSLERRNSELTARIAELEALAEETEEPIHICGSTRYRLTWGGSEMAEVTGKELWEAWTQLTEARKDGQILDWIEKFMPGISFCRPHQNQEIGCSVWSAGLTIKDIPHIHGPTLRSVITTAMLPSPKETL